MVYCKRSNDPDFTVGKWYKVIDYRIIDDTGIPRPGMIKVGEKPIKTVEDIKNFGKGNWSWIGEFISENSAR